MQNIMREKRLLVAVLFLPFLMVGCSNDTASSQLAEVDSLLVAEQKDSAYHLIQSLDENKLTNPEDKAHYYLLKTRIGFLINQPLSSDSLLDLAIEYYKKVGNQEKLADCYYYKSARSEIDEDYPQAILYAKEAERLALNSNDVRLQFKIAEILSYLNGFCGNDLLQLQYAKKSLAIAQEVQNKNWIEYSYNKISFAFANLDLYDSALVYVEKSVPYLDYVYDSEKAGSLTNIGLLYKDKDTQKAKEYFEKALTYGEHPGTLEHLADVYFAEGKKEKAYTFWKKALATDGRYEKDNLIYSILSYDLEHGNLEDASKNLDEVIAIKDSIITVLRNDTIKDLQLRFDHQAEMNVANERLIRWQWALGLLGLFVFLLIGIILWMRSRAKLKLKDRQLQIVHYASQLNMLELRKSQAESQIASLQADTEEQVHLIEELKADKDFAEQELQRLNEQMEQKLGKEVEKVSKGYLLYEDIEKGKTTQLWKQEDYEAFIAYYSLLHREMVRRAYRNYPNASPRNMFFLILKDMGKSTEDICRIMCMEKDSIRSIVYRLNHSEDKK